ncbi:hypothetical protein ACFLX5_04410 [Chloroflexota bacterium]
MAKGYLASFVIGAIGGGFAVAHVSKTLPSIISGMISGMKEAGLNPSQI